ncbi:unnamed protein product [Caenorhabditis angaria]|uniref:Uncharacterized protein n=1 Tax=Caenorhabditis angaria TaxID=860376 RepID=A0A9P1IL32_9PELO|nr:unnamed protein product [Caenorhabditis angaria]
MDLLDLYHAHEFSQIQDENAVEIVNFKNSKETDEELEDRIIDSEETGSKVTTSRKAKYVPWEPYKAAVAPKKNLDTKCPVNLPQLIAYSMQPSKIKDIGSNNNANPTPVDNPLTDTRREKYFENKKNTNVVKTDSELKMEDELKNLKNQLEMEKNVNSELKRLMIATLNDELQNQVEALTEDKVILAHRVNEFMGKLQIEDEESDKLKIDRDVWKCKFLAQSIRCDELSSKNEFLLKTLVKVQDDVKNQSTSSFANLNLQTLFNRSPCEEKIQKPLPKFSNLTITCCKNCAGREIHLL